VAEERPAFTLDEAPPRAAELPILSWALACAGLGLATGAFLAGFRCLPPPGAESWWWCGPGATRGPVVVAGIVGAVATLSLPVGRGGEPYVRLTAVFTLAASVGAALLFVPVVLPGHPLLPAALLGLAAPCAGLTALRPDARLTPWRKDEHGPKRWLGVGAIPAGALFAGFSAGTFEPRAALASALLLALAGASLLVLGSMPEAGPAGDRGPKESRAVRLARMTPMLRRAAALEWAQAMCLAACVSALLGWARPSTDWASVSLAALLGGLVGALIWKLWSHGADARWGRGSVLTMAGAASALAPLALFAATPALHPAAFLAACALAAFALSSAPQRHALLFDLAASRARLRISLDAHAVKWGAAAGGGLILALTDAWLPGLELPLVSALGFAALASFAPTLGSLGRRAQ
jgi:hypothetical protein